MMRSTIITLVTLASSAAAVGNAVIKNNCPQTIYAWSVGSSVGTGQTLATGKSYLFRPSFATLTNFQAGTSPRPSIATPLQAALLSKSPK
jgi:hypothetical protein